MRLPGFTAPAALLARPFQYRGTHLPPAVTRVVPAQLTFEECIESCGGALDPVECAILCAALFDVTWGAETNWGPGQYTETGELAEGGEAGAEAVVEDLVVEEGVEEAGLFTVEAFGLTGVAALSAGALALGGIAFAVHDFSKAYTSAHTAAPPVTPAGCIGSYTPSSNITGWSVPFQYPGCGGAWDHAQVNAQAVCDAHTTCIGTCPDGKPCKPVAILVDRVDETRWLVTCEAEGQYFCQCGCQ